MRIPFFSSARGTVVAVADIGGGGVSIALVRISTTGPSTILAVSRSHVPLELRDQAQSLAALAQATKEAADAVLKAGVGIRAGAIRDVYAIVHAPWVSSKTVAAERAFESETKITDALISELAKEALAKGGIQRENLLEANVSHIELNGYTVQSPRGQSAHSVKVVALMGEMNREQRSALEAPFQAALPGVAVKWRSQVRAMSTLLHESTDGRNAVVVDVADNGTSITVMRKQELAASVVVPVGIQTVLAQLSPQGSREETLALLSMLESGTCSNAECERVGAALSQAETSLTKNLGEPLGALASKRRLPNQLFVLSHADLSSWIARFFARLDFAQFTVSAQPFSAHPLKPADFSRFVAPAAGVRVDAVECMAAALVHTEQQER